MDKKRREPNYDMLRILSTIAVITIHVSAIYKSAITDASMFGENYVNNILTTVFYNTLSRFAVPCFVMLSGAFILADARNVEFKYFYKKSIHNIGIPTICFSIMYFVYSLLTSESWLIPVKLFIMGKPFMHMWYLYMLVGVYLLAPIVIRIKNEIGEKAFLVVSIMFLIVSSFSMWTSKNTLAWDVGTCFEYLSYFMIGYVLRKVVANKDNLKGMLLFVAGFLLEAIIAYVEYYGILNNVERELSIIGSNTTPILIASLLIFVGVSYMEVKTDLSKLAASTFYIYLFHGVVCDIYQKITVKYFGLKGDNQILIPVGIVVVFSMSYLLAILWMKLWNRLETRFLISNKICESFFKI